MIRDTEHDERSKDKGLSVICSKIKSDTSDTQSDTANFCLLLQGEMINIIYCEPLRALFYCL